MKIIIIPSLRGRLTLVCMAMFAAFICITAQANAQTVILTGTVVITVEVPITETVIETIIMTQTETITVTETVTRTFTVTVTENITEEVIVTDTVFVTQTVPVTTTIVITDGTTFEIDFSDAPNSYGLAAHLIDDPSNGLLLIGNTVNGDSSAQPGLGSFAQADTSDNGVELIGGITVGEPLVVSVDVFNNTGEPATLVGYVDLNGDGMFTADEEVRVTVPSSPQMQTVGLTFGNVVEATNLFSRFRVTTESGIGATGLAADGEVEDWFFGLPTAIQLSQVGTVSTAPLLLVMLFVGVAAVSGFAVSKK